MIGGALEAQGLQVLVWHVHGSWLTSFVQGAHTYLIPATPEGGPWARGRSGRDWPDSAREIAPGDLASALGADQINSLAAQSGMSSDELLKGLSQYLPDVINHLTPDGRLPNEHEISGRL